MNRVKNIGLLGFGEFGRILGDDLGKNSMAVVACDPQFENINSDASHALMDTSHILGVSAQELGAASDIIFSVVTAEQTVNAVRSIAPSLKAGAWVVDMNSASPGAKCEAAQMIGAGGGRYVEAAVMSPVPDKRLDVPILLGGPHAKEFMSVGAALGLNNLRVFSGEFGKASATKMCRSIMVKGIEALLLEALITAQSYGVADAVLASLDDLFPGPNWRDLSHYMIGRTLEHGKRRAEEMREAAVTVSETGLIPSMSIATVARQSWAKDHASLLTIKTLEDRLDALCAVAHLRPEGAA